MATLCILEPRLSASFLSFSGIHSDRWLLEMMEEKSE